MAADHYSRRVFPKVPGIRRARVGLPLQQCGIRPSPILTAKWDAGLYGVSTGRPGGPHRRGSLTCKSIERYTWRIAGQGTANHT